MNKIIGILLILGGLALGYQGITTVSNSSASVEILDIKIDASNESGQTTGYLYLGGGLIMLLSGVYLISKKGTS